MPANMSDLPECFLMPAITNEQRLSAALVLAGSFHEKSKLAYFLVQLGLATHEGTFHSTPDAAGQSWFTPVKDRQVPPFHVEVGTLDDCREVQDGASASLPSTVQPG